MSPTRFNPNNGIAPLSGKVILITGGNSGLGKETVLQLAKHSPQKIYLAARNERKAREAIKSIDGSLTHHVNLEWLPCDTADLKSVKQAANIIQRTSARLDILILNVGIMATPAEKSSTGHDLQLMTNHIGHFLLTKELLPLLKKTAAESTSDVRVITISSSAQSLAPGIEEIMSTERLCAAGPWRRYGASKAANVLFAAELARRHPEVTSVSAHPGMIRTDLWKYDNKSHSLMKYWMSTFGSFFYVSVEQGAYNQLYLAAGAKPGDLRNGSHYTPVGSLKSGNSLANDVDGGRKFWDWTEAELAKAGY